MAQSPLTVAEFRAAFPEFVTAPSDPQVQSKLDEALRRTPSDVWGDQTSDAQGYLAAHLIATSPFGTQAALSLEKDGSTRYRAERDRMEAELGPAVAPRVT